MIVSDKQKEIIDEFGELPDVNMSLGYSKRMFSIFFTIVFIIIIN